MDDIATNLENLHNLLSQQFNYNAHKDHYPLANEIRERLQFEHYSRNPMLQEVPRPEIVPTLPQVEAQERPILNQNRPILGSERPRPTLNQNRPIFGPERQKPILEPERPMLGSEENLVDFGPEDYEEDSDDMSFEELPQHAKNLILQQFRNRNPSHPFNRNSGNYNRAGANNSPFINRGRKINPTMSSPTAAAMAAGQDTVGQIPMEKRKSWTNDLLMLLA